MEKSLNIYFGSEKQAPVISFIGGCDIKDITELEIPTLEDAPIWAIIVEDDGQDKKIHNFVVGKVEQIEKIYEDKEKYYIYDEKAFLDDCLQSNGLVLVCETSDNKRFIRPFTENDKSFDSKEELVTAVVNYTQEFLDKKKQKVKI